MNDKNDPRARLVAETFHDDWSEGPASEFALRAAAHARTQRFLRRAFATGGAFVAVATGLFFTTIRRPAAPPAVSSVAVVTKPAAAYEIISDDELIRLLRDRPLLILPQERADRRFVLLAQSTH